MYAKFLNQSARHEAPVSVAEAILIFLFALTVVHLFIAYLHEPWFSADTWQYFELSNNIFNDFYKMNTIGIYHENHEYQNNWPPLWPISIALVNSIFSAGVYGGYGLGFVAFLAFTLITEVTARRIFGRRWLGLLSAAMLLGFWGYRSELTGARSIPLNLMLIAGVLCVYLGRLSSGRVALLGILMGLAAMTRFDALPSAIVLTALVGVTTGRWRLVAISAGAILVVLSPWMIYSWDRFGEVFAMSHSVAAWSADPDAWLTDWHLQGPTTVLDAPFTWLAKVGHNAVLVAMSAGWAMVRTGFAVPLFVLLAYFGYRRRRDLAAEIVWLWRDHHWRDSREVRLLLFVLVVLAPIGGMVLTGYRDHRYFSALAWDVQFTGLILVWPGIAERLSMAVRHPGVVALAIGLMALIPLNLRIAEERPLELDRLRPNPEHLKPIEFRALTDCLQRIGEEPPVMFVADRQDHWQDYVATKFGALTGHPTLVQPGNWDRLPADHIRVFVSRHNLQALVLLGEGRPSAAELKLRLTPVEGCDAPVFHVAPLEIRKQSVTRG